ncbi:MAG: SDR family oxidoreductase [Halolamina sp.]
MDLELDGTSALVTASSSGLGKASATALAREGANVVVNGRDEQRLAAAVDEVDAAGDGHVVGVQGDLTEKADIEHLVERTVEEFGGIDSLVTSAGGPPSGSFMDTTDEDWYQAYDLLVMSAVRTVRAAAPHLKESDQGTMTFVTSRSVKEAIDSLVLSNAVRMAVIGLEKTLSKELAPEVRANSVLPGPHETSRIEDLVNQAVERGDYEDYEEGLADWGVGNPMKRIGDPMELGDTVAFLSSPKSSYINGVALPIEGGAGASNL